MRDYISVYSTGPIEPVFKLKFFYRTQEEKTFNIYEDEIDENIETYIKDIIHIWSPELIVCRVSISNYINYLFFTDPSDIDKIAKEIVQTYKKIRLKEEV